MGWSALTSWIKSWKTNIRYLKPDGLVRIDELDQVLEEMVGVRHNRRQVRYTSLIQREGKNRCSPDALLYTCTGTQTFYYRYRYIVPVLRSQNTIERVRTRNKD
jgi:hypothetical protein